MVFQYRAAVDFRENQIKVFLLIFSVYSMYFQEMIILYILILI